MPIDPKQYDSAVDFISDDLGFSRLIGNMSNNDDRLRMKAYDLYENFYHNRPEHIRVVLRGEDDDSVEIYIPSAKKCLEAINRFLAVDFDYHIDPDVGDETARQAVDQAMANLFKREKVYSKFNQMKRYMLIKGDALFHVVGLPWERAGQRIKIMELKPEHFFPIEHPVTGQNMGCHIVDVIANPKNSPKTKRHTAKFLVRRQTYRKLVDDNDVPTGRITSELSLYEIGHWDDRVPEPELKLVEIVQPEFLLPGEIRDLPVYHWKHRPPPGSTFGMSLLAGVESIMNAINQAMTDEDLTLITQGLGIYWTDASPPTDENGNEVEWEIGPGSVVQIATGGKFDRVTGVSTVAPYHEHVKLLDENMQQALGVPDIAIGMVDVQTAESGIALQLKLGPMLAANAEAELLMIDETDEFLSDLVNAFLPAYEGVQPGGTLVTTQFGDPMPVNQEQALKRVLTTWAQAAGTMPVYWLYEQLNEIMGWELDFNSDFDQALDDASRIAEASSGPQPVFGEDEFVDEEDDDALVKTNGNKQDAFIKF